MKVRKRNGFISIELALIAGLILSFGILITNKYIAEETQAGINMESEISDVFGSGKRNSADGGNTGETPALPDPIPEPEPEQPKEYVYIVNHWLQKPGGGMEPSTDNFILKESSGGTAIAGTAISPDTKTYSGYKTPDKQTVTITTNSQNINYYYLADSYTIDGMWRMKDNLTSISKNLTEKVEFTTAFNEEVLYEEMGVYRNPDGSYDIEVAYLDYDLSGNLQAVDTVYYFYEWDDENNQIITFTHEQTVSSEFYEWFMRNAEPLLKFRLEIRERNRVVDTLDFYACPGMTWLEFVQSDFNIDGYFYMIRLVDEYSVQTSEHLSSSIREDDGAGVSGGALVKNDHVYYQEIGSSSGGAG